MKNIYVLKDRELHNHGIESKDCDFAFGSSKFRNFDLLVDFVLEEYSSRPLSSCVFSFIGFDFGFDGLIRQIQPLEGYDFIEVFNEVYHNKRKFGDHFCILHHDLSGFHYLAF